MICLVLGVIILTYSKDFLLPIIIAGLLSLLLYPLYKKLTYFKIPAILSVIITMLIVIILISSVAFIISTQIKTLVADIGNQSGRINDKLNLLQQYLAFNLNIDTATMSNYINDVKEKLLGLAGSIASGALSTTTNFFSTVIFILIFIFCFLLYNRSFSDFAFFLLGSEHHEEASGLISKIQKLVRSYLTGLFTVILIIGTCNSMGLLIIGVKHALFFSFFAAMLTIIPYIGIFIGATLPIVYILLTMDSAWSALGVLCVMMTVQFLESNFITPRVVGSKVSINPFVAIVVLFIGGELWGLAGMALSIPLTAILKLILDMRPGTKALGYFLGSEFTDDKKDPFKLLGKKE